MAKQRGVVQLSGRVDNLCYYQQKGIRGGLVRRVNLAMSERVKTGTEYVGLRSANSFFGACSMCASAIIQMTGTRANYLHLGDRQAIFTRAIYDAQKAYHQGPTVQQVVFNYLSYIYLPQCYENIVKNKMSNFFPSVPYSVVTSLNRPSVAIPISSVNLESYCRFYKCAGVQFTVVPECYMYSSGKSSDTQKYLYPENGRGRRSKITSWMVGGGDLDLTITASDKDDAANFVIILALPIVRQVGGRNVTKITGSTARLIGISLE